MKGIHERTDKSFIFFRKNGVHVQYSNSHGFSADSKEFFELQGNHYQLGLRWAVDGFFEKFLQEIDLEEVIVVYSADHGQEFKEMAHAATHCDWLTPVSQQAAVPLLIFGELRHRWFPGDIHDLYGKASQFQIYPSILSMMGYDISSIDIPPLWRSGENYRVYASGDIFASGTFQLNAFRAEDL